MPSSSDGKDGAQMPSPTNAGTGDALILRDVLAIDRTRLANERTLLAWLRTGLMLSVSGVTLIKLFEGLPLLEITGYALIPCGFFAVAFGLYRFLHVRARIETTQD
jgi:putative membrane protein